MNDDEIRALDDATAVRGPVPGSEGDRDGDPFAKRWRTLDELGMHFVRAPKSRRWLLTHGADGALPMGKVGMLVAGGGTGKTAALVQLALAVALGESWLGSFDVAEPGRVLLALGEEDREEVQRRFYRAAEAMELSSAKRSEAARRIVALPLAGVPVALTTKNKAGNIAELPALASFRAHLQAGPWSLVILDPLARFAGDDTERDNAAATRFVQAIETLVSVEGGPTVLLAHHSSKASLGEGAANSRGSSALVDGCRWVASLNRAGQGVVLSLDKTNYTRPWQDVFLHWTDDGALVKATEAQAAAMREAVREEKEKAQAEKRAAKQAKPARPKVVQKPTQTIDESGFLDD